MFREFWNSLNFWKRVKLVFILILSVLVLIFAFQNWVLGELRLVFISVNIPVTLLIAITFFIGYSLALISNFKKVDEKEKEIRKLKVKLEDLQKASTKNS